MRKAAWAGRVCGFRVDLHYSWFLVFAAVSWLLATGYLNSVLWQSSLALRVLWAGVASLVFFACVVAHEVGHALVARRYGVPVERIELFALGGATRVNRDLPQPEQEFQMAIAGPLVSLALTVVFGLLAWRGASLGPTGSALAAWIADGNLCLALFNLFPGIPLDGGRILRAFLWRWFGDRDRATRIAAQSGRILGVGMMLGGLWLAQESRSLAVVLLAVVGWFLDSAASESLKQLGLREGLKGHTASEGMVTNCPRVPPGLTLDVLVNQLGNDGAPYCFPVMSDASLLGVVSSSDVEAIPQEYWPVTRAAEAMQVLDESRHVAPEQALDSVLDLMLNPEVDRLAVMDGGRFLGLITRDVLQSFPTQVDA